MRCARWALMAGATDAVYAGSTTNFFGDTTKFSKWWNLLEQSVRESKEAGGTHLIWRSFASTCGVPARAPDLQGLPGKGRGHRRTLTVHDASAQPDADAPFEVREDVLLRRVAVLGRMAEGRRT